MRLRVGNVPNISGFTVCNVPKDHYAWMLTSTRVTSDDLAFYRYINQISEIFFSGEGYEINPNAINNFLILVHRDMSADIYLKDFPYEIKCRAKRYLKKGTVVKDNDIADIRELRFPSIDIKESDSVICCLKVDWKFGLYFNFLTPNASLDVASMQVSLGQLYRYLAFQYVYQSLESKEHFREMIDDGWFPFVSILGNEYKTLVHTYQNEKFTYDNEVKKLIDSFDKARVENLTKKWWQNPFFQAKQQLFQAGINAFLQKNESGYINCVKTLYTEIEGIMRSLYFSNKYRGRPTTQNLIDYLVAIAERNVDDNSSLLLPQQFLEYLTKYVFKHFDVTTGTVDLSRHSIAHGAAEGKDYTSEKALQGLLILDQIYFYLFSPSDE